LTLIYTLLFLFIHLFLYPQIFNILITFIHYQIASSCIFILLAIFFNITRPSKIFLLFKLDLLVHYFHSTIINILFSIELLIINLLLTELLINTFVLFDLLLNLFNSFIPYQLILVLLHFLKLKFISITLILQISLFQCFFLYIFLKVIIVPNPHLVINHSFIFELQIPKHDVLLLIVIQLFLKYFLC